MDYAIKRIKFVLFVAQVKLREWAIYRFRLFIWIISGIVEPIVWSVLWYVVSSNADDMKIGSAQVLTYYALIALMSRVTQSWTYDELRKEIYEGRYSKYILWPSSMVLYRLGLDLGNKIMNVVTMLPFWIVWVWILIRGKNWEVGIGNIPVMGLAMLLAILVKFSLDVVLAHLGLWVERAEGIGVLYTYAQKVCGGIVVPLMLLPDWARIMCNALPLRYIFSFPVEVMMGTVKGTEVIWGFTAGVVWCAVMAFAVSVLLRKGLPRYEAVGI